MLLTQTKLLRFDGELLRAVEAPPGPYVDLFVEAKTLHLLTRTRLLALGDDSFTELAAADESIAALGGLRGAARGPAGHIYLSARDGVAWRAHDGQAWAHASAVELGYAEGTALEVAFDGSGRAWIIGPERAIYATTPDDPSWRETDKSTLGHGFDFGQAQPSSFGPVHVNNNHRLTRLYPAYLDSVLVDPRAKLDYELLALAPSGHALVATHGCALGRVNPQPPTKIWRVTGVEHGCDGARAIALDSRLRAWVASDDQLSVIHDDRHAQTYAWAELLAASQLQLDGPVLRVVVLGEGPELDG